MQHHPNADLLYVYAGPAEHYHNFLICRSSYYIKADSKAIYTGIVPVVDDSVCQEYRAVGAMLT